MKNFTTDLKVNRSLRLSIFDGASYNAMLGLTQDFIAPFALALKASTTQIGLLSSLPNLALALSQLGAPYISERLKSRKSLIVPLVLVQALLWLPLFLLPQLFNGAAVWWLIGLFTAGSVFGMLGNPAWGSMMADLVPQGMRGRYFGSRNRIGGLTLLLAFFVGGAVLQLSADQAILGFAVLFGGAAVFRLASAYFVAQMYEPPPPARCPDKFNPIQEIKRLPGTRVGRFSMFVAAMMLATYVAGPFFAVYMLRELGFSYWMFVVVTAAAAVSNFLFMGFWGRCADKIGHLKVVRLTSLLIPINPILWLGGIGLPYLIAIQVFSGFSWSGFNLSSVNFLYEAAAPERRTRAIAIYNALSCLAICTGALLGGLLAPFVPEINGHEFLALFLLSGLLRGVVVATLLPRTESSDVTGQSIPLFPRLAAVYKQVTSRLVMIFASFALLTQLVFSGAHLGVFNPPAEQKQLPNPLFPEQD